MDKLGITNWLRYSVTFRIIVIGVLILLLLIPLGFVRDLVYERKNRKVEAVNEISQKWGGQQTIIGPILSIPYQQYGISKDNQKVLLGVQYAHFLPEKLNINTTLEPQIRSRGIFDAVVYSSKMNFSGKFTRIDTEVLDLKGAFIDWDKAFVSVGISDTRGIKDTIKLNWNKQSIDFKPGIKTSDVIRDSSNYETIPFENYSPRFSKPYALESKESYPDVMRAEGSGISVLIPGINNVSGYEFSFDLSLNGSQDIQFVPVGKTTEINMKSSWNNPSFQGAFLPDIRNVDNVDKEGFEASWKMLDLNRGYPQAWLGSAHNVYASASGVKLLIGIDDYAKTERSAKYALLIISITFLILFFVEIFNKKRIHPIQYILVGLVLVLFYVLLISISEVTNFDLAYLVASIATIGLITLYSKSILENEKIVLIQFFVLVFLHLFTYIILQLEDYALLGGSLLLFTTLAVIMYLSRKVDWYGINQ
jgi:inner membrane protein